MKTQQALLAVAMFLLVATSAIAADLDFAINLQQRDFTPGPIQKQALSQRSSSLQDKHIIMQFDGPLDESDKRELANAGIDLISYIPNYAYTVFLTADVDQSFIDRHGVRWFGQIYPDDKISPLITDYGIGDWARRGGNLVEFTVVLHQDEDLDFWAAEFETMFNAQITGLARSVNAVELIVLEQSYLLISDLDAVIWIEQAELPRKVFNNVARINTRAEELQTAPYNLTGNGVTVAEWDGGQVDATHTDLMGRVNQRDGAGLSDHATHVAGTVLGTGAASTGTYRGMAPQALLLSYLWWGSSSEIENEYNSAINSFNASISTNSWGTGVGPITPENCAAVLGNYFTACATLDDVVRGSQGSPITICWAVGNERGSSEDGCGSLGWTYGTIGPYATAKNPIGVGAISSGTNSMTSFSSWGPTDDGRLKPDIVGPGCTLTSCAVGGGYWNACGTSMSTPATSGTIALMLEALINSTEATSPVLPSTVKGILINTAEDLGNPGPDYAFGNGKVDGVRAVDKIVIGAPSYVEDSVTTGTTHIYDLTIPGGTDKLRVTLAWDDPGGVGISGGTLINDLDLVLIDPFSTEELPLVLNPSLPADWAAQGVDNINNVETVDLDSPLPGLWKAKVTGFNIPTGPQAYSLIFTPDSIHTPGNLSALAVFDIADVTLDPGDTAMVEFWVTNVGANPDSIGVEITDDAGWLLATVSTSVTLAPWDSAFFSVEVEIPDSALAGELATVSCAVVSMTDSLVTSGAAVSVVAAAFYDFTLASLPDDTVASPDTFVVQVIIDNLGNDFDHVIVRISDDFGWGIQPISAGPWVPPYSSDTVEFSIIVPAEVPHLAINNLSINAISDGGAADTTTFQLTANNPFAPPALLTPLNQTYTQSRVNTFTWSSTADSFSLQIATDAGMVNVLHEYRGIVNQSFDMPVADSLDDGIYHWAVRMFVGVDSSSLQANPFTLFIDNEPPLAVEPVSPANGQYVGQKVFSFTYNFVFKSGQAAASAAGLSPEFGRIELSQDSTFASVYATYEPISGLVFIITDTIDDGRWYWRVEQADSAGNNSGFSPGTRFIMDSETPAVPTQLLPADSSSTDADTIRFSWSSPAPPPIEHAPEFYFSQFSTSPLFFSVLHSQQVFADSLKLPSSLFTQNVPIYWRVRSQDSAGHISSYQVSPFNFTYTVFVCGDVDGNGIVENILELTFLVDYFFRGGPSPNPLISGSINCDTDVNILDLTYMVDFIFRGGQPPCCL